LNQRGIHLIATFVIGSIILTAIIWGAIIYGPEFLKRIRGEDGSAWSGISIRDIQLHPEEYLGQEVAVEGYFLGPFSPVYIENEYAHTLTQDLYTIYFYGGEEPTLGWNVLLGEKLRIIGVVTLYKGYGSKYIFLDNATYVII